MEIKTCEEYVLNELVEAQNKVDELEDVVDHLIDYIWLLVTKLHDNGLEVPDSPYDLHIRKMKVS